MIDVNGFAAPCGTTKVIGGRTRDFLAARTEVSSSLEEFSIFLLLMSSTIRPDAQQSFSRAKFDVGQFWLGVQRDRSNSEGALESGNGFWRFGK